MKESFASLALFLFRLAFRRSAARAAVASFGAAVVVGTFLLMLPISSKARIWTAPVDCLFTATSAVCVTGLLVKSTPDHWSLFGQGAILLMIQIGGLGIMTMGAFVAFMLKRRLSIKFEAAMSDIVDANEGDSVRALIRFICIFTLVAEVLGAVSLYLGWRGSFSSGATCAYHSVFHSISAFCNAGFSLNNDSLVRYVGSAPVNLAICALIVVGGVGFAVVRDVKQYVGWWLRGRRGRLPRLTTHTKLVLTMTGILLLVGFVIIFVLESHSSLHGQPLKTRVLAAMFQSVTPRTAGFNTIDMGPLREHSAKIPLAGSTVFLLMTLMYIGGSPGGTAGGIKTTTIGIMIASITATLRGRSKAELFHHSVAEETVHRVASILLLSAGAVATGVFLLLITETAGFRMIVFEAISAFGTVGLSTGLTGPDTNMTPFGKLILTVLMFVGRLGPITLVLSVAHIRERGVYRYPEDQILVG